MLTEFLVPDELDGQRLDSVLRSVGLSQKRARDLCAIGAIALNDVRSEATARVSSGQRVLWPEAYIELILTLGIAVAFADDDVIVLQKPPGLASHAGPLVLHSVAGALLDGLPPGAGLAHRLDRESSGLMMIGRSSAALRALAASLESGAIQREYLAIAGGVIEQDRQKVDLPLLITDEPRGDKAKAVVDPKGQPAVSHVQVVHRRKQATLVRVHLETGRTHQIRAHLAAIGHPILGDARYGDVAANRSSRETFGVNRTMLHSAKLSFPQPVSGDPIVVTAFHEPDFVRLFPQLGRD